MCRLFEYLCPLSIYLEVLPCLRIGKQTSEKLKLEVRWKGRRLGMFELRMMVLVSVMLHDGVDSFRNGEVVGIAFGVGSVMVPLEPHSECRVKENGA